MSGRILILEDDSAFAEMLSDALEANDFEVFVSLDPDEAIKRVREERFDLLVSDFVMPKLEGTDFIRQIRDFNGSIPVIMISAFMGDAEMKKAARVGVTRVLIKPFEVADLVDEIQILLDLGPLHPSVKQEERADLSMSFPEPLQYLCAGTQEGERFVKELWAAFQTGKPIFATGERGFEMDAIASELALWNDPEGGMISLDLEASELLGANARALLTRFAGKDGYSRVVVAHGLDRMDRSGQRTLAGLLEREDSYLRNDGNMTYLFPVTNDRLALAEMSMEERLLEIVFGNRVRVPPLAGRYRDIAGYLTKATTDGEAPVLSLEPEAAAHLLRYDWPGNFEELLEVRHRLGKRWQDSLVTGEQVRLALEKRLKRPLDEVPEFALNEVLCERQNRILGEIAQSKRINPAEVLQAVAAPEGVEPAQPFPHAQALLHPGLLEAVDAEG